MIKLLLKNDANCKAKDISGDHAANCSARFGNIGTLKLLVEKDVDVIDIEGQNGETPLIAASRRGWVEICRYLVIEKKTNVN